MKMLSFSLMFFLTSHSFATLYLCEMKSGRELFVEVETGLISENDSYGGLEKKKYQVQDLGDVVNFLRAQKAVASLLLKNVPNELLLEDGDRGSCQQIDPVSLYGN